MINETRPANGETWASIPTTWRTEIRTWLESSKLIHNLFAGYYIIWSAWTTPWEDETRTWNELYSIAMTNQSRNSYHFTWDDWTTIWNLNTTEWEFMPHDNITNISRPI